MKFEWDTKKAVANEKKHSVSFHEASSIFGDPVAITFDDPDHAVGEAHYLTFGISITRIISARIAARQERKIYEEG